MKSMQKQGKEHLNCKTKIGQFSDLGASIEEIEPQKWNIRKKLSKIGLSKKIDFLVKKSTVKGSS